MESLACARVEFVNVAWRDPSPASLPFPVWLSRGPEQQAGPAAAPARQRRPGLPGAGALVGALGA